MAAKTKKSKSGFKSIYVVSGKDAFLVGEECRRLLDALLPAEQRAMALYQVPGKEADITEVLDELRTLPFLAERRVVLITDADEFISANRDLLEKYFENPSPSGVLVLRAQTWRKNTRLAKKLSAVGEHVAVGEMKASQLPGYVANYARTTHDKTMTRPVCEMLVELAGDDPGRLSSEVDKLAMYVDRRKTISCEDVEKLIGQNRMFNAFAVIDAITAGDAAGAVGRLRNMFAADKSAEFKVVGAFAYHLRKMFAAKALMEQGLNRRAVIGQLRLWGNLDGFFGQLSRMSLQRIGSILAELARIDYSIKTGRQTCKVAVEQLVLTLATKRP